MSEMIERATEAVIATNDRLSWSEAREISRAVIVSIREPTEEMFKEVYDETVDVDALDSWRALIDAALKEEPKPERTVTW